MEMMREWARNLFVVILALTFIETLMPSSRMQSYIRFIFSLVIMNVILSPLIALLE